MTVEENTETVPPQPRGGDYAVARFNALRHGVLSQYTVLPWEDGSEYQMLVEALVAEHNPKGPTEEHLVEELAGTIWRKRRLRLSESAVHHRALDLAVAPHQGTAKAALVHVPRHDEIHSHEKIDPIDDAIRATDEQTAEDRADVESDQAMTEKALARLRRPLPTAYSRALAELRDDTRTWWEDQLAWEPDDYDEDETPYRADAESLRRFLESEVLPWYEKRAASA